MAWSLPNARIGFPDGLSAIATVQAIQPDAGADAAGPSVLCGSPVNYIS
jgi:hypothetical protein